MMCLFNAVAILLLSQIATAQILPNVEEYISILNDKRDISDQCSTQMNAYFSGLLNNQSWAWNILDATPKVPYGILTGNLMELGNYDECMRAKFNGASGQILGKYCTLAVAVILPVHLTMDDQLVSTSLRSFIPDESLATRSGLPMQPETGYRTLLLSICIPSACTPSEVLEFLYITSLGLPVFVVEDAPCETINDLNEVTGADIGFIVLIGVILAFVLICTAYDEILRDKKKPVNPLYVSFSVTRNFKKIVELTDNSNRIPCLDGLRVFSILWVMLGHRFSIEEILPFVNKDYSDKWLQSPYTQYAQGATSAVDTFMFLTGLLMAMSFIKTQSKPKAKFNILSYYIHRYLRLTPALAVVYFLHVSVFLHLGSGPLWTYVTDATREKCLNRWASFFFYYQNYLDHNNMCLLHTWYLSMDMQIFILSPAILIPLVRHTKLMMRVGLPILIFLSMVCPFLITYIYETQIFTDDYYMYYYYPTHTRLSSWLIGVLTGALIYKYREAKLTIHPLLNFIIWAIVVVGMAACVFCGNDVTYNYDRLSTSFYLAFYRPAWCLGLAWVVYACMKGRGGIFDYVLSADLFQILARITYSMYLVHVTALLLSVAQTRYPGQFRDYETIHLFLGDILTTTTLAFIWCVLFESPLVAVEKFVFGGGGRRRGNNKTASNPTQQVKKGDQPIKNVNTLDAPLREVQVQTQPIQNPTPDDNWKAPLENLNSRSAPPFKIEDETTAANVHDASRLTNVSIDNDNEITTVKTENDSTQEANSDNILDIEANLDNKSIHDKVADDNKLLPQGNEKQYDTIDTSITVESEINTKINIENVPTDEGNVKNDLEKPVVNDEGHTKNVDTEDNQTIPQENEDNFGERVLTQDKQIEIKSDN